MKEKNYIMLKYFAYCSQYAHTFSILRPMQEIEKNVKRRFISNKSAIGLFVIELCKTHEPFEDENTETEWLISTAKECMGKATESDSSDKILKTLIESINGVKE